MGPVLLSFPPASQLRGSEAPAKKQNGAVEKNLKTLGVVQMKSGYGNVPAECKYGTREQYQDTGNIFRPALTPFWLVIVRAHARPPIEK